MADDQDIFSPHSLLYYIHRVVGLINCMIALFNLRNCLLIIPSHFFNS